MGATLTDAVLQSGITYNTVVLPRVERILRTIQMPITARLQKCYNETLVNSRYQSRERDRLLG
jgi:hypothetical protein